MRLFVLVYVKFTPDLLRMSPLNLAFELRRRCATTVLHEAPVLLLFTYIRGVHCIATEGLSTFVSIRVLAVQQLRRTCPNAEFAHPVLCATALRCLASHRHPPGVRPLSTGRRHTSLRDIAMWMIWRTRTTRHLKAYLPKSSFSRISPLALETKSESLRFSSAR